MNIGQIELNLEINEIENLFNVEHRREKIFQKLGVIPGVKGKRIKGINKRVKKILGANF